jgi:hypothetical protein
VKQRAALRSEERPKPLQLRESSTSSTRRHRLRGALQATPHRPGAGARRCRVQSSHSVPPWPWPVFGYRIGDLASHGRRSSGPSARSCPA